MPDKEPRDERLHSVYVRHFGRQRDLEKRSRDEIQKVVERLVDPAKLKTRRGRRAVAAVLKAGLRPVLRRQLEAAKLEGRRTSREVKREWRDEDA